MGSSKCKMYEMKKIWVLCLLVCMTSCGVIKYSPFHDCSKQEVPCTHPNMMEKKFICTEGHEHVKKVPYSFAH